MAGLTSFDYWFYLSHCVHFYVYYEWSEIQSNNTLKSYVLLILIDVYTKIGSHPISMRLLKEGLFCILKKN